MQLGIVTADLERAMRVWTERYGVGDWKTAVIEKDATSGTTGDGDAAWLEMRVGSTTIGALHVELLEPTTGEGIYAESLARHGGADHIHHVMCICAEYDLEPVLDDFARKGVRPLQSGARHDNGLRYVYLDTAADLGFILELTHLPGWTPDARH